MKLRVVLFAFAISNLPSCKPSSRIETSEVLSAENSPFPRQPASVDLKVEVNEKNGQVVFTKGTFSKFIGKLVRPWSNTTINAYELTPISPIGCGTLTIHFLDRDNEGTLLKGAIDVNWLQPDVLSDSTCLVMQTYTGRYKSLSAGSGRAFNYATNKVLSFENPASLRNLKTDDKLIGSLGKAQAEGRSEGNGRTNENFVFTPKNEDCGNFLVTKLSLEEDNTYWKVSWDANLFTELARSKCAHFREWEGLYSIMN